VAWVARSARASADLDEIWLSIALDSPSAADRLIDRILQRCLSLANYPRLGPARPEIAHDARMLTVGDYIVLYRINEMGPEIVRVVHGARRLDGLFDVDRNPSA
jgi:toxin ParE1/3/4